MFRSTDRFVKNYGGPRSLLIAALGIKSYRDAGAPDAFFTQKGGLVYSLLGSTLFVCGLPRKNSAKQAERMANMLGASAVLCQFRLPGRRVKPMTEMKFTGTAPPASPAADIADAVKVIYLVSGIPADRLLIGYISRVSAGLSALYCTYGDDRPIAAAAADYIYNGEAVLGSVSVLRTERGRHLGFSLAAGAAACYKAGYLICEPELAPHYAEAGFTKTGDLFLNITEGTRPHAS